MINYKTLKFNGNIFPYADIDAYDYNLNRNRIVRVSTEELENSITEALFNGNDDLKKRATQVDPSIELFIPKEILLTKSMEEISNYVTEHLSK